MTKNIKSTKALSTVKVPFNGQYLYIRCLENILIKGTKPKTDMELFGKHLYVFSREELEDYTSTDNVVTIEYSSSDAKFEYMVTPIKIDVKSI